MLDVTIIPEQTEYLSSIQPRRQVTVNTQSTNEVVVEIPTSYNNQIMRKEVALENYETEKMKILDPKNILRVSVV